MGRRADARRQRISNRRNSGFSLIEVLVAMGLLAVGMSGVLAMFSAALAMQKEATERYDVGQALLGIAAEIEEDLAMRLGGSKRVQPSSLNGTVFPVPGDPMYSYRVSAHPMPGDETGMAWLCKVVVIAKRRGEESVYDLGYLPVIPRQSNDKLIQSVTGGAAATPGPKK